MSEVQVFRPSALEQHRANKALSRLAAETGLAIAVLDARATVEAAKAHAIGHVTISAMQEAALVSQVEQSLAQVSPHASGRLATIADLGALSMADVVANAGRRIAR